MQQVRLVLLISFLCACGSEPSNEPVQPTDTALKFELAGNWESQYGYEAITDAVWKSFTLDKVVSFDNTANVAITQNPADATYYPDTFNRIVWTEIVENTFYYCMVDFKLDSAEAAQASTKSADTADLEGKGCGGSAWSKLARQALPYATFVKSFTPGPGAGYHKKQQGVVLGAPKGGGINAGSLDVLSLGQEGEIVLAFDVGIKDGEGADFIVFENPFKTGDTVFTEFAQVGVSDDGVTWFYFPCDPMTGAGCAGQKPVLHYDPILMLPLIPEQTGGDIFDLETVHLGHAKFVSLRDVSTTKPVAPSAGFDLDAVGIVNFD
jgi:hypothetical protein